MPSTKSISKLRRFEDNPKSLGLDNLVSVEDSHINESKMSVTALISTPKPDKARHVVNPLGGDYSEYKANPIVLWEHGLLGGPLSIPIATSADRHNVLQVHPKESGITATSFFSERNKQSEQFFALIADKIIRATSVRFRPTANPVVKSGITYYNEWIMEEWSWAAFGVNPDAVAGVVAKGRLAGMAIDSSIFKSLIAQIPERRAHRIALDFAEVCKSCCDSCKSGKPCESHQEESMGKSMPPKDEESPEDFKDSKGSQDPEESQEAPAEEGSEEVGGEESSSANDKGTAEPGWKTGEGEPPEEEAVYDQPPEDTEEEPSAADSEGASEKKATVGYGAKMLRATHKALKTIHGNMDGAFGELEHPGVKERLSNVHRQIGEMAEGVAGYFASTYPNLPMEDEQDAEQQKIVKSLLAKKPIRRLGLVDVITDLRKLNDEYHEPILKSSVARLEKILHQARFESHQQPSVVKSQQKPPTKPEPEPVVESQETPPKELISALQSARQNWAKVDALLKSMSAARK